VRVCQYVTHALRSRSGSCAFCRHCHSSKQQQSSSPRFFYKALSGRCRRASTLGLSRLASSRLSACSLFQAIPAFVSLFDRHLEAQLGVER
jgi:hypothetical protein